MNKKIPVRFFVITFLWSWLIWLPFVLAGFGILNISEDLMLSLSLPIVILGAFGPAVGAVYTVKTLEGNVGLKKFLKSFLDPGFSLKLWASIFLVLGLATFAAWYVPELFGFERVEMMLPSLYIFPVYWLVMVLLGGGQEEIGWRGYIMPLLESRFGLWTGNIILGLIWAFWHLPLWFIPGTLQTYMPFVAFTIGCIGLSFFLSWVIKKSNGRPLSGLIAHGTFNAFLPVFPPVIMEADVFQLRFWTLEILLLFTGILLLWQIAKQSNRKNRAT